MSEGLAPLLQDQATAGVERHGSSPGREVRTGWRDKKSRSGSRSRSRSPHVVGLRRRNGGGSGGGGFDRYGSNTTRDEPHLQRARLFVGNVDQSRVRKRDLIRVFSQYGEVTGVSIHKGYAFVQMDRERNANKAINFEDNQTFMGSKIHVEFSQAALKAGAKFEPLRRSPPPGPPPVVPPSSREYRDRLALLEIERQREESLARILQMEKELTVLRDREAYDSSGRRNDSVPQTDTYRSTRRASPDRDYGYMREERNVPVEQAHSDRSYGSGGYPDDRHGYYNRPSPRHSPPSSSYRSDIPRSNMPSSSMSYRGPVDPASGRGGGGMGNNNRGISRGSLQDSVVERREGGGHTMPRYGSSMSSTAVGYSSGGGGVSVKSSSGSLMGGAPPGWPSGETRTDTHRTPFAGSGPWN